MIKFLNALRKFNNWFTIFNCGYNLSCIIVLSNNLELPPISDLLTKIFLFSILGLWALYLLLAIVFVFGIKPLKDTTSKSVDSPSKTFKFNGNDITISKYPKYDEYSDSDYMVYEVTYSNGTKGFVSKEIYEMLEELYEKECMCR